MWLIGLGVASGVIGFGTYLQNKKKVREQEEVKALARRRAEVSSKFRNDKAEIEKAFSAFFFEIKTEWPYCIPLKVVGDVRSYLMMSRDGSFIRVANLIYIGSRGVRLKARDIATARIRSVRVYQGQTVLTTSVKQEREVIEPGKSKSSIKRAIVGGIVLGPWALSSAQFQGSELISQLSGPSLSTFLKQRQSTEIPILSPNATI